MNARKDSDIGHGDLQAPSSMSDATTVLNERDPDRFDRQFEIVRRELAPLRNGVDPRISDEQLESLARRIVAALRLAGLG
jgi:hypothetical protein